MKTRLEERIFHEEDFIFYIRDKQNKKLGLACLFVYEDYIEITNFFIRRKERGKGIGKKALKLLKKVWKNKCFNKPLRLVPNLCDHKHNSLELSTLRKMYNKAGFFEINELDENDMNFFQLKENF